MFMTVEVCDRDSCAGDAFDLRRPFAFDLSRPRPTEHDSLHESCRRITKTARCIHEARDLRRL